MIEVRKRLIRPTNKTVLIVALLFGTIISAFILGSTFSQREGGKILASRSRTHETTVPGTNYEVAKVSSEAAVASDSAKLATGFATWDRALKARTEGMGDEDVAELTEVFIERMVIFTAKLELEVKDIDSTVNEIRSLTEESGGFVAGVSTSKSGGGIITVRVPQEKFYEVIWEIEKLGEVKVRELKGEDITESYVDLEAQLKNLQKQEKRLIEILEMCVNVEEVLKVESELKRVRGEIEGLTGEIKYIEGRVELATITVSLTEVFTRQRNKFPKVDWWIPVEAGLQALFTVTQGLITLTIVSTPFIAVGLPAYYLYKRGNKRKNTK